MPAQRWWSWALATYLCVAVLGASFAADLYRNPIQISDSLGEILSAQASPSLKESFLRNFRLKAYLRPLRIAQIKALFDWSGGRYHLAYRGFHTALFVVTLWAFIAALRVSTATDFLAALFASTVFLGIHTFPGTVASAYPVNTFLEMTLFSLVAVILLQGEPSRLRDVAATAVFAIAALTLESGLLVWVVLVTGWLVGFKGVSRRGVLASTVLLAGYMLLRFVYLDTGTPMLSERSSGFGLGVLEPEELEARFGDAPIYFYAYNVVSSVSSVLFAEPRSGVWTFTRYWLEGEVPPWATVAVVSSTLTTLLMVVAGWRMYREREVGQGAKFLALLVALVGANAVLGFAYTKDEIMSVAGGFYALAAFAAVRHLLRSAGEWPVRAVLPVALVLVVASAGWATRTAGLHHILMYQGFKQRSDWMVTPPADTEAGRVLVDQLRADVIGRRLPAPRFVPRWTDRWFEE